MNSIITQRRLVEILSKTAGVNADKADQFVKAFTTIVRESLVEGESVTINGVGTFSVNAQKSIEFVPDQHLAETINAPFAMFQPEELAPEAGSEVVEDTQVFEVEAEAEPEAKPEAPTIVEVMTETPETVTEGYIITDDEPEETSYAPSPAEEEEYVVQAEPKSEISDVSVPRPQVVIEPEQQSEPEQKAEEKPAPRTNPLAEIYYTPDSPDDKESEDEAKEYEEYAEEEPRSFPYFWAGWALALGLIIGLCIGFFVHDPIQEALAGSQEEQIDESISADEMMEELNALSEMLNGGGKEAEVQEEETEAQVQAEPAAASTPAAAAPAAQPTQTPTQPAAAQPVAPTVTYDYVTKNLTALAKKHYGDNNYWPYIYKENEKAIGDPAKVQKDLKVIIPPKSKYDVGPDEAANLANAKRMAAEINKKYGHK